MKKYLKKERALRLALEKIDERLDYYNDYAGREFHDKLGVMSEDEKQAVLEIMEAFQWGDWYDLKWRIEQRIKENTTNYNHDHFKTLGWSVISR